MNTKAIVGFLDILGYDKLVEKFIDDVDFIKQIDDLQYEITIGFLEALKKANQNIIDEAYFRKISETIRVRFIFDNVIFSLPFADLTFSSREFDRNTTVMHCLDLFFFYMALVSTLLISKIGHLHRGGLSVGNHYESNHNNYLFIFSEAHNKAVRLEKIAISPRILLDDSLKSLIEETHYPNMDKFFYKDAEGCYCFDIYSCFEVLNEDKTVQTLSEIKEALKYHMDRDFENKNVLAKLIYFAKYHNKKVTTSLKFPEFAVDIGEFEKII